MYTFVCDSCGKEYYSKVDPSGWRTHKCNACSGKQFRDYPVESGVMPGGGTTSPRPSYSAKPVPVAKPSYSAPVARAVPPPKSFDLDTYIMDLINVYGALKVALDEAKYTVPEPEICKWTTSIMIQKEKMGG